MSKPIAQRDVFASLDCSSLFKEETENYNFATFFLTLSTMFLANS